MQGSFYINNELWEKVCNNLVVTDISDNPHGPSAKDATDDSTGRSVSAVIQALVRYYLEDS